MPGDLTNRSFYHEATMKKLILFMTLLLAGTAWAQTVSPPPGSQVNTLRPQIRVDFNRYVDDPRVYINGRDYTRYAEHRGDLVWLNPPRNLDYNRQNVQVVTEDGLQANWAFDIVGNNGAHYPQGNNYPYTGNNSPYYYPDRDNRYPDNDNDLGDVGRILPYVLPYILRNL